MTDRLPPPVTTDQAYAAALLDELRGLRADLRDGTQSSQSPTDDGEVLLTEPEPARPGRPVDKDLEVLVEDYAASPGWYQIPGVDKKLRRDDAIAALREV